MQSSNDELTSQHDDYSCTDSDFNSIKAACAHASSPAQSVKAASVFAGEKIVPIDPSTHYRVRLPRLFAQLHLGVLTIRPKKSGTYSLYSNKHRIPLILIDDTGRIEESCSTQIREPQCQKIRYGKQFELQEGVRYTILIGPAIQSQLRLIVEPEPYTLQLLHAADFEAGAEAVEDAPRFSAVLNGLRHRFKNTVILASGDNWIPGPFFSAGADERLNALIGVTASGRPDIAMLNAMGVQASCFGNHEFDAGPADIAGILGTEFPWTGSLFPYLSANIDFSLDPYLAPLITEDGQEAKNIPQKIAKSALIHVNGETIGIVGATTPTLSRISSPGDNIIISPSDSNDLDALAAIIQKSVDRLTSIGIDKVIVLAHMQQLAIEQDLSRRLKDVDIVVAGGSNTILADETDRLRAGDQALGNYPLFESDVQGNPIAIVNTDGNYRYVGRLVVSFDNDGQLISSSIDPEVSGTYATDEQGLIELGNPSPDPQVEAIANEIASVLHERDSNTFGMTTVYLDGRRAQVRTQETNLGNLSADANLATAQAVDPSVLVSIKNGGGIRQDIGLITFPPGSTDPSDALFLPPPANPGANKKKEEISQFDIENALRFNNGLVLLTLSALNLKDILEHAVAAIEPGATSGQFPQVGGLRFSFDRNFSARVVDENTGQVIDPGQRIRNVAIVDPSDHIIDVLVMNGQLQGDPNRSIRLVTLDFLADGGDGYPFPTVPAGQRVNLIDADLPTGNANFASAGSEQDTLAEFLVRRHPETSPFTMPELPPSADTRIQNLEFRSDGVFTDLRWATFNASLHRPAQGDLITELSNPNNSTIQSIAEVLQRNHPDVVLINEFDFDPDRPQLAAQLFRDNYLSIGQNGASPIHYPYAFVAPSNTGVLANVDINNDGQLALPGDAFGFGFHPGQFGMLLLSKFPIAKDQVRTFQKFRWIDMPNARLPDNPNTPETGDFYSPGVLNEFRLSSKSHWDVPIQVASMQVHVLASHPTPPVFDGPEDANGRRNADEIRFWADYVQPGVGTYIVDDAGDQGPLPTDALFVMMGDLNADPLDGESTEKAIDQLLTHPFINTTVTPRSNGAIEASLLQGGSNANHLGNPAWDTADFSDTPPSPGNLRVDYVLPSTGFTIIESAVFWPTVDSELALLNDISDHHLVFLITRNNESH